MTLAGARICLVTSGPVGSDPRLLKEAHALHEAGALVRVVAANPTGLAHVQERDAQVLRGAPWRFQPVDTGGTWGRRARAIRRRVARALWSAGLHGDRVARLALDPLIGPIARTAALEPADLFIAHNLPALPAAASAARIRHARLGFDAEDFHRGQLREDDQPLRSVMEAIEERYLPQCTHFTAASPGIAQSYAAEVGVPLPTPVLNVFPLRLAPPRPTPHGDRGRGPSIYWFSQTVGPGRGLEEALAAIARSRSRPRLVLQGSISVPYRAALEQRARQLGVSDLLEFEPPALPDDLPAIASRHDLGLATEPSAPANPDRCLSNKLFTYLLGGVPVLASATSAQAALAKRLPDCMWALPWGDAPAWAERIDSLLLSPDALADARRAAWRAGQSQYAWEHERTAFLRSVAHALAGPGWGQAQ